MRVFLKNDKKTKEWMIGGEGLGLFSGKNALKPIIDPTTGEIQFHFVMISDTDAYAIPDGVIELVTAKEIVHLHLATPGHYQDQGAEAEVTDVSSSYLEKYKNSETGEGEIIEHESKYQTVELKGPTVAAVYELYRSIRLGKIEPIKKS